MKEVAGGVLQPPITRHRYAYKLCSNYDFDIRI
jgi:hypothetical protein